jgi:hypothetical protein
MSTTGFSDTRLAGELHVPGARTHSMLNVGVGGCQFDDESPVQNHAAVKPDPIDGSSSSYASWNVHLYG